MSLRATIREVLAEVAPGLSPKDAKVAEKKLIKGLATVMVRDGYTLNMCASAIDVPASTLKTWRNRDAEWKQELAEGHEQARRWLLGALKENLADGGKAASASANILANLWCPELRDSKVEATVSTMPNSGDARGAVVGILNKSKPLEIVNE